MSTQSIESAEAGAPAPFVPNRYCWPAQNQAGAADLWEELATWVNWLRERYELQHTRLPACWYRHGAIVEELTALMAAWHAAYHYTENPDLGDADSDLNVAGQFSSSMAYWHRSFLWPCLADIKTWAYEHRVDEPDCFHHEPEEYPADKGKWIAGMIASRPAGRPTRAPIERTAADPPQAQRAAAPVSSEDPDDDDAPRSRFMDVADMGEAVTDGDAVTLPDAADPDFPDVRYDGLRWTYDADREDYRSVGPDEPPER